MQLFQKQDAASSFHSAPVEPERDFTAEIDALLGVAKRQWRLVAVCVAASMLLGVGYLLTAVPQFTASSRVLLDRSNLTLVDQLSAQMGSAEDDTTVLSQVEVLKSDPIILAVVDKLELADHPVFMTGRSSLVSSVVQGLKSLLNVSAWFGTVADDADERDRLRQTAAALLAKDVDVDRVQRSYVLEISYTSPSPNLAAAIVNAISSEYLLDKLNSKYDATRRASEWLSDRIKELRDKALETDLAVQKFKAENNLIQTGTTGLLSDQQLSDLNSQLIVAQSETARARARLERVQHIVNADQMDAVVTDILESVVANDLRKKFLESSKLEAEISRRLGPTHIQAVRLRNEMQEYKRLMFQEMNRLAESYKSDLDVAVAKENSLRQSVQLASGVNVKVSEVQVQLRELEREADTYKNLYQTFLQRYQEAVQQQSFPVTDARILTSATPPQKPSKPVKSLILALFMFVGGVAGCGLGAFREFRDRFFRTGDQVRSVLKQEFLGNVMNMNALPLPQPRDVDANVLSRLVVPVSSVSRFVLDHPLSSVAETLRGARMAIDLGLPVKGCRVIGVVSTLPGEGKTTISANLAQLLANQGARVMLIDADVRNPGLTRSLGRHAREGLLQILMDARDYRQVALTDPQTGLAFIPTVIKQRVPHSAELLMSGAMRSLLTDLRAAYDYVIIDLPPLGPVIDARAISDRIDGYIYVVEWGDTARRVVRTTLENERQITEKCLGVILNKVDMEKLKLYRAYGSGEYYTSRYVDYYRDEG